MRQGKKIVVWAVAIMMVANSASAFRWRHWGHCQPVYCGSSYSSACYESSCGPADCGVVYEESGCCASVPADCSNCEVTTDKVPSPAVEFTPAEPVTPQPTLDQDVPPAPPEPAPVERTPPVPRETFTPAPAAVEPAPVTPAPREITPPAATPIPAPAPAPAPSAEVEDLFSQPETTPVDPQTKPAEPAEVEDLFKEPEAAPAKPTDEVDDLFKDLDAPSGNKAAASEAPAAPNEPSKEVEDLFSEPAGPMAAAEPKSDSADGMRLWSDNTGEFQVRARLVVVGKTHVRLLKDTGKFTTVPYSRLSQTDLAFVRTQTDASKVAGY